VYIGDTADDLDLVLRYRAERRADAPELPPTLAVSVASGDGAATFRQRGADITLTEVSELPAALHALRQRIGG
jgi:phosphoglycolate phosphatase-like HAD superfamily hydrolase